MINCFVRALRKRRPSIREDLEAITEDKDVQVTVQVGGDSQERPGLIVCKPKSAFAQSGYRNPKAANCDCGAANFSRNCNKAPEVTAE
ncbi:hypothetical protein RSO01_19810 [Reyranella soli]|uniref:Uncharacterized protein n=1 Tax=Reyranella soli TaxID=1230389 RepID=A0A512N752_9HYPH|nr:hypothetical protein RSO01_19810 [Reyranella soli]